MSFPYLFEHVVAPVKTVAPVNGQTCNNNSVTTVSVTVRIGSVIVGATVKPLRIPVGLGMSGHIRATHAKRASLQLSAEDSHGYLSAPEQA